MVTEYPLEAREIAVDSTPKPAPIMTTDDFFTLIKPVKQAKSLLTGNWVG
jgi:hypothetical protein